VARFILFLSCIPILAGSSSALSAADDHGRYAGKSLADTRVSASVMGPVEVLPGQSAKVCISDISTLGGSPRSVARSDAMSSTGVWIYAADDLTTPLRRVEPDLVLTKGAGSCFQLDGDDLAETAGASTSIVLYMETHAASGSKITPVASAQLRATDTGEPSFSLLLPAVQSARSSGGHSGQSCCACAPVCGCGLCPD